MSIHYQLIRSPKRKTISIEVLRDQSVVVRAPQTMSEGDVQRLMIQKENWVNKQRLRQAALPQKSQPLDYSDQSTHYYLGKPIVLLHKPYKYIELEGDSLCVPEKFFENDYLQPEYAYVGHRLKEWYRREAKVYFTERLEYWLSKITHWQVPTPQLRLRYMKSYWGSCNSKHRITLNVHLIKTPPALIDYVITHELSHLKEMNHSAAFYQYQESLLPDWSLRRKELRQWELKVLP